MSLNNKARLVKADIPSAPETAENQMKALLTAPAGLEGLIQYIKLLADNAETEYRDAACRAVFTPDERIDAVHKHGRVEAYQSLHKRLLTLRSTGQ